MNNNTKEIALLRRNPFRHSTSLLRDERGLSTVEYLILLAVIVVGCVGIWNNIGTAIDEKLQGAQVDVEDIGNK